MAVPFTAVGKTNPSQPQNPLLYYPRATQSGVVDLEELSERVSDSCSVTPSDCSAVIIGLVTEICRSLDQGNIVRLGQLGSFQVSVQGTSSPSPEEVESKNISRSSIVFRPGKKLKNMLNQLKFYKKKS